ncbi:MAG: phenylalanine--tRNA ligase subunit beta [Ruminococcaceae bacterium]|nr:phenylalanine--tRNA ligase subunit beta [Oscillospiraceae bacterium]
MLLPLSWLNDYVDVSDISIEELETKLFASGFEVEETKYLGKDLEKVVVGKIKKITKHEDSDHLQICIVDCGEKYGTDIQIVTGAQNVFEGALVPAALDGSTLPGGVKIKKGKLRGVESNGMLCSGEELGINDNWYDGAEVYGILILKADAPVGEDIAKVVGLDDYVFDISITANRPDCQSILGMAREVAAIFDRPLKAPDMTFMAADSANDDEITVEVSAFDLCPRYIGHYVRDVKIEKSPLWMRKRLALVGINAINNIVDITNFILMELGQPMHAFDLSTLDGKGIRVRRAKKGEKIITLDEKEFELCENNLVICDLKKPVALAGIMGGLNSEIKETTTDVLFESAKFARDSIRKTSRSLGQTSDSSAKFCKGVDEYTTEYAQNRALNLIEKLGCGTVSGTRITCAQKELSPKTIKTTFAKINKVLGIEVKSDTITDILRRLDFNVDVEGDNITVSAPLYREDVEGYEDLAEEVIRIYGYEHIVAQHLKFAEITNGGLTEKQQFELKTKTALKMQGAYETINFSFYSQKDLDMLHIPQDAPERKAIRIDNPISENYSIMATTLAPIMLSTIIKNYRNGNSEGRFFEIANVFLAKEFPLSQLPHERKTISLGAFGDNEDFFTFKGIIEGIAEDFNLTFSYQKGEKPFLHPGITADIFCEGEVIGYIGQLSHEISEEMSLAKKAFIGELDYEKLSSFYKSSMKYKPVSQFHDIVRDFAFVCDEKVTCGEIEDSIKKSCKYVTSIKLFDIFRGKQIGEGKKSMAFNVIISPEEKGFSDKEIEKFTSKILKDLEFKLGVSLR